MKNSKILAISSLKADDFKTFDNELKKEKVNHIKNNINQI